MKKAEWIIIAGIAIILGLCIWQTIVLRQQDHDLKNQIQTQHASRDLLLEERLRASERGRMALDLRCDSLNHILKALVRVNQKQDSLLKTIKGSYNKRTPTELESEMIKRYRE